MAFFRRFAISVSVLALLVMGTAHCGSAYPYMPPNPASSTEDANNVGGGGTSTGSVGGTTAPTAPGGTSTGGATTAPGGTSTGTTTGSANPNVTTTAFSLTVQGQGFFQDGGDPVSAQLLDASGQKTGAVATSNVQQNGEFLLDVPNALDANTAYSVAIFIASAGDTHCNQQDQQWLASIPAGNANVTLQLTPQRNHPFVCGNF